MLSFDEHVGVAGKECADPGDPFINTQQVFMVSAILGQESGTSPAEVSNCIPFWAASVCSYCKKANKLLETPKISFWAHGVTQQMVGRSGSGQQGPLKHP